MNILSNGQCAQIACILEATARKPGNVHRFADFEDATYLDFLLSAAAIAGPMDVHERVGEMVFASVEATRRLVATNTNLGMILLLAPLAVARAGIAPPSGDNLRHHLHHVLQDLTLDDARHVYAAIRLARPGGLGTTTDQDVCDEPTVTLLDAMRLAADRDLIARQYANDYADVFDLALPAMRSALSDDPSAERAIIHAHLTVLSQVPDTLIARKLGPDIAAEASRRARAVLDGTAPIHEFDRWLRSDGHRRNPGATADLIAAALFAALSDGTIEVPSGLARGIFTSNVVSMCIYELGTI
jgi:triphosphoribosyl-dephospho-CoA synthase